MKQIGELIILGGIADVYMTDAQKIETANSCKNGALVYAMEDDDGILSPVATDDADMRAAMASMGEQLRSAEEDARLTRVELDAARDEAKSLRRLNDDYQKEIVTIDKLKDYNKYLLAKVDAAQDRIKELQEHHDAFVAERIRNLPYYLYTKAEQKPSLTRKIMQRCFLLLVPVYLISAFVSANWNAWEWTAEQRAFTVIYYIAVAIITAIISAIEDANI